MESFLHSWNVNLFPLRVIFSNTLALSHRVAWACEASKFNQNVGILVFEEPRVAKLAFMVTSGSIFIEDSASTGLDPGVFVNQESSKAVSAVIRLPVKNPEKETKFVREALTMLFRPNL